MLYRSTRFAPSLNFALVALILGFSRLALSTRAAEPGPVARWKLHGDIRDHAGDHHGENRGVDLSAVGPGGMPGEAAAFDGRRAYIEAPAAGDLRLGTGDFSISAWVHTSETLDDALGDIVSCYDPATRRGFSLGVVHNPGVANNQSNSRNVHFGIDNGSEPRWTDCGRPGNAVLAFSLAVFQGQLYAGTCEGGKDESGRVFRYEEGDRWTDCGSPDPCNAVTSLVTYQGELYAGVSKYRLAGSALGESENMHPGGKVYRYAGSATWQPCGKLPGREAIGGMVVFRGQLYASSLYKPAGFFRYEGGEAWTELPAPGGLRVEALAVHNGEIFASSYDGAHVYRFDGQSWTDCGQLGPPENTQSYCFAVYQGVLHAGTWPTGRVYRYMADGQWTDVGRLGEELEVMGMAAYNGKLYAGSLPLAKAFRFDGDGTWTDLRQLDLTPDVRYRRLWTMAEYQGRLFCTTLPSGRIHSMQAGASVGYDRELAPGWRHLAAMRAGNRLLLYVDGELVATSTPFAPEVYDLSTEQPWRIGFGPHDYWNGRLADVRVYRRALGAGEVRELSGRSP